MCQNNSRFTRFIYPTNTQHWYLVVFWTSVNTNLWIWKKILLHASKVRSHLYRYLYRNIYMSPFYKDVNIVFFPLRQYNHALYSYTYLFIVAWLSCPPNLLLHVHKTYFSMHIAVYRELLYYTWWIEVFHWNYSTYFFLGKHIEITPRNFFRQTYIIAAFLLRNGC